MADAASAAPASTTQNPSPNGTTPGNAATSEESSTGWTDPNYKPPPGHVGSLTPSQQNALDQFKKELQDEDLFVEERMDDSTLLRYVISFEPSLYVLNAYFYLKVLACKEMGCGAREKDVDGPREVEGGIPIRQTHEVRAHIYVAFASNR